MEELNATDLDTGVNAEIRYRIQHGSFDDFHIDNATGVVTIAKNLDYDRRNTYVMEIVASDMGTPSLSGTSTLTVHVINSNDKAPYFTPTTQRTEVSEDAAAGTLVHALLAVDPDVASADALEFSLGDYTTAVHQDGSEVVDSKHLKEYFAVDRSGKVTVHQKLRRDLFAVS